MTPVDGQDAVLAVVLAGGLARRMGGGDKPLRLLGGRPLLDHVLDRVRPQVAGVILNANGDPARFAAYGLPVVADPLPDFPGPLAGVLAALDWAAAHRPEVATVLSVPGDGPFLPPDLVARLQAARAAAGVPMACAASGGWTHPPIALWPVALRGELREALLAGEKKIDRWTARWSIWRTSAGTTRWTRSPAGCSATPAPRATRSSTPPAG